MAIQRHGQRAGKLWIGVPDKPVTKKPLKSAWVAVRAPWEGWVCVVKPGK